VILTIPGLWNSGPEHWQSHWERERTDVKRVEQAEWEKPRRADWIASIRAALRAESALVVLAAHSLGCCTVAHLAKDAAQEELAKIKGALLVAPSDFESPKYPPGTEGFVPLKLTRLPFKSIVVYSEDDEWVSVPRALEFAAAWGARAVNAGARGHLNSASKLGSWPEGQSLLRELGAK
jgi:predicted alpha/beta hydrolase family esterase